MINMPGRADYEERKQMKKERYEELADKARQKSKAYIATHDKISNAIPFRTTHSCRTS